MRIVETALVYLFVGLVGCRSIPTATPEERKTRDHWAALVPEADRRRIMEEADRHGDWGDKRKIRYEVEHFERIVKKQSHPARTTQPATAPSVP